MTLFFYYFHCRVVECFLVFIQLYSYIIMTVVWLYFSIITTLIILWLYSGNIVTLFFDYFHFIVVRLYSCLTPFWLVGRPGSYLPGRPCFLIMHDARAHWCGLYYSCKCVRVFWAGSPHQTVTQWWVTTPVNGNPLRRTREPTPRPATASRPVRPPSMF